MGACGSARCRARIRYVKLIGSGVIPVDFGLEPGGPLIPEVYRGAHCMRARRPDDAPERPGFTAHWSSCPDPNFWTAYRQRNDTAAVTPTGLSRRGSVELGPCAGCYWPGHLAYGPNSCGTLCPVCVEVLAAWRASPPPRGPIRYPRWNRSTGQRDASPLAEVRMLRTSTETGTMPADPPPG